MIENIVIAGTVSMVIYSVVIIWRKSENICESLLMRFFQKKSTGSMDLDNLIRVLILIFWLGIIWTPIIYVLSLIFD